MRSIRLLSKIQELSNGDEFDNIRPLLRSTKILFDGIRNLFFDLSNIMWNVIIDKMIPEPKLSRCRSWLARERQWRLAFIQVWSWDFENLKTDEICVPASISVVFDVACQGPPC